MKGTIFFIALFGFLQATYAQEGVTITAYADKSRIVIGERLKLTIEVFIPAGNPPDFPLTDTIEHFEFLSSPKIDTIVSENGTEIKGVYTLTSFDSGHWVIPSFYYHQELRTDTIPVDVVFSEFDPAKDYHDLRDIMEIQPEEKNDKWWYIAGALFLLLLIVIAIILRRRKKPVFPVAAVQTDPYQDAMNDLQQLESASISQREFHSRLSDIFRLYIFRKQGILSLQKTTDSLILQLKDLNLPKQEFDQVSQALRLGDFVKFAKCAPTKEDDNGALAAIKKTISAINNLPQHTGAIK